MSELRNLASVAKIALGIIEGDRAALLESHCVLDPKTHAPRVDTLDPCARRAVAELDTLIITLRGAIDAAEAVA